MKDVYLNLKRKQDEIVQAFENVFTRKIVQQIAWDERMIGLVGERGVGKTTIMLQRLQET
ncbi:MAG: hypothetical protein LBH96_05265 [Candidatus Peribacteria bacterium]|jgi:flagellar biosynthesis GTPase FlhF|nr:hypothetical protein [Candidatus Peribacteria bacterium]